MAVVKINLSCELTEAVKVQYIRGNLFSQDNQANVINVAVFEGGEPTELAGTVTANVIRPDGGTVSVTGGTFEGNVATITMPSAVYAIPGMISVAVKITLDSVVTTIAAFAATVYATSTDTTVDPGTIIPSIQTLIAEIEAAVDSIPADYSSLWATLAPNYSNLTFPVAVGQYCTYNGGFYRCNTAIATQEAWTAAHWTATNIGADLAETRLDVANLEDDVSELKSAIGTVPTGKTVQGQIDALENGLEKGTYEDLTAGNALYLLSDRGDTDVAPYVFRKTGGAKNGYGREFLRKIVGGTVAWNQLARELSSSYYQSENVASISFSNGIAKFTASQIYGRILSYYDYRINTQIGHKYLVSARIKLTSATNQVLTQLRSVDESTNIINKETISQTAEQIVSAMASTSEAKVAYLRIIDTRSSGWDEIQVRNLVCFDLTAMFGSTIADAIYAMEQATAGSGVAWFRSLFPNSYYAYDAGSLQSVQAKEHRTVGFNQWDEEWELGQIVDATGVKTEGTRVCSKNFIRCRPNTTYYFEFGETHYAWDVILYAYDANKNYLGNTSATRFTITSSARIFTTSADTCYLLFQCHPDYGTTYKHNICINISDVSRNGQYEPYAEHTYPLDSSLTLRGIPKLDSTNGMYYDGDEYTPDGSVKRKYGIVDLGTLGWYRANNGMFVTTDIINGMSPTFNSSAIPPFVCAKYLLDTPNNVFSLTNDKRISRGNASANVWVVDSAYSDAATFKTAMSGVYLVYELATPTTEQADGYRELQISAHGGTEEFVDAGVMATTPTRDVSVPVGTETFYPIDVVAYIEELTNPDHDMIADALIPSGKYFMVGNSLYKSTSQIQAGATIIPGSNCTAKTLAEALNELNT